MSFSFFFLFSFFFYLNLVRSSSKQQNLEIYFLCKVVKLQKQFCLPKIFGATLPEPPQNGVQNIDFFNGSSLGASFFL